MDSQELYFEMFQECIYRLRDTSANVRKNSLKLFKEMVVWFARYKFELAKTNIGKFKSKDKLEKEITDEQNARKNR